MSTKKIHREQTAREVQPLTEIYEEINYLEGLAEIIARDMMNAEHFIEKEDN